jgi:hypothetical protein
MFIKNGAQYRVYSIWGRRVIKVPHNLRRAQSIFRGWSSTMTNEEIKHHAQLSVDNGHRSVRKLEQLSKLHPAVSEYLCRPRFYRSGSYSQLRVKTLDQVFSAQDFDANLLTIEAYAVALLKEWEYGFCESEFNICMNNGLNAEGGIVLIDFGDVVFSKAEVERVMRKKPWLSSWSYTTGLPKELRKPFAEIMARTLTPANLKHLWRTAL